MDQERIRQFQLPKNSQLPSTNQFQFLYGNGSSPVQTTRLYGPSICCNENLLINAYCWEFMSIDYTSERSDLNCLVQCKIRTGEDPDPFHVLKLTNRSDQFTNFSILRLLPLYSHHPNIIQKKAKQRNNEIECTKHVPSAIDKAIDPSSEWSVQNHLFLSLKNSCRDASNPTTKFQCE